MHLELDNGKQLRLNKISRIKDYFIAEILEKETEQNTHLYILLFLIMLARFYRRY